MNRVQELIDENMEHIPTGLVKRLLDACKAEADAKRNLYRVTVTRVTAITYTNSHDYYGDHEIEACVKLHDHTESVIVEKIAQKHCDSINVPESCVLSMGYVPESWIGSRMPLVFNNKTYVYIVHSIEPYTNEPVR